MSSILDDLANMYELGKEHSINNSTHEDVETIIGNHGHLTKEDIQHIWMGYNDNHELVKQEDYNIYFRDLNEKTQNKLCKHFKTTPEESLWYEFPLCTVQPDNRH